MWYVIIYELMIVSQHLPGLICCMGLGFVAFFFFFFFWGGWAWRGGCYD